MLWLCLYGFPLAAFPALAQVNTLPATACALVADQVVCFDRLTLAAHEISPPDRHVTDFAIDPSGEWVVYRIDSLIVMASIYGVARDRIIDQGATPPAELSLTMSTIDWSPDGIAFAYVTADGLR